MAFQFPVSPNVGDTYNKYTWNGHAWRYTAAGSVAGTNINTFLGPTTADNVPDQYNVVVVDRANGMIRVISPPESIVIE